MDFFINEFSILSPTDKKAFNKKFKSGINLIVGEKDSGKSSLARSILYTLGCDVKNFDFLNILPNNIYILDFNIDLDNYILIRKKLQGGRGSNYFRIIKNQNQISSYYDTKSFKDYLNEIMNIKLVTRDKQKNETKLYPNHIFLPFYTDQDYSWQNYLSFTFNHINFIDNYKKIILEYFTGERSNDYYTLQLKKSELTSKIDELSALIKSKEIIINENNSNIHIIENIDIESFKTQYKYILEMHKDIIDKEHKLKASLNEKIYKKNTLSDMKSKINSSIENIIYEELNEKCPNCNQIISKSMEENYKLFLTQENLVKEREIIDMNLFDIEKEITQELEEISKLQYSSKEIINKLNANGDIINLANRADSYALSRVNEKLLIEISNLRIERDKKNELLNEVEKQLSDLNKIDVATKYRQLMIEAFNKLNIPFAYNNYYISNLESVKIGLSGASKVQAYIAQYLAIYEISMDCINTINIPMFIDTFLKDDFNNREIKITSEFIFDKLKNKNQSFIFISNNKQTLDYINMYDFFRINLSGKYNLLSTEYERTYNKYSDYIVG